MWLDVDAFHERLAACEAHNHPPTEACLDCVPLLEEAAALYRDHFLSGFTLRDSAAFDEFQFFRTEALKDQLAGALQRLVHYHSDQGDFEPAVGYARRWLALDPLHEPSHRHLMALYARAGQQSAALRQYQLCEQTLAQELGLPPSEETKTLYERIRSGAGIGQEREPAHRPPHNLPPQLTPFVGREEELADLDRLIGDLEIRLVTVAGPGGIGKTRLALAAAERQLDAPRKTNACPDLRFPDGVFFVSLAALSSIDHIVPTVAKAMSFSFREGRAPRGQILDYLREKRSLLIMDGFDRLLSGSPLPNGTPSQNGVSLLAEILQAAPGVKVLVTSRERLHLHREQVYPIQGLPYPDWATPAEVPGDADLTAYAAVELFLQSARRAQPHLELVADDVPHLTRICCLVEGMPLGIELAAAWVDILSLTDIAAETQRSLEFLEADWRGLPARHRSIRAVFDISWERLSQAEQETFAALSVFHGGFTLEAAKAVAGVNLRTLLSLVSKSLLRFDRRRDRYDVHELLRQYGSDKLREHPENEAGVCDRHSAHYCAWLGQREAELKDPRQGVALAEIEADIDNTQAAWTQAVAQRKAAYIGQATNSLCGFLELRNRHQEGEATSRMAAQALAPAGGPRLAGASVDPQLALAQALAWQARFSEVLGRTEAANQLRRQSLALLEGPTLADQKTRAIRALALRPIIRRTYRVEDASEVRRRCEQSLALCRAVGDQWGVAEALFGLGAVATKTGAFDEARPLWEESLSLYRRLGNQWRIADVLNGLGWVARGTGAYDQARKLWEESATLSREGNNLWGVADSLSCLGSLALFQGQFELAHRLAAEECSAWRETGHPYRHASGLFGLGVAYWLSGQFAQAHATYEEAAVICQDLQHSALPGTIAIYRAELYVHMGRYEEARAQAELAITLSRGTTFINTPDPRALRALGWTVLAREQYAEARRWLEDSVAFLRTWREVHSQEFVAWSLAALGRAAYGLGNRAGAQAHLHESLEIVVEIRAFIPLLHLMPIIPVVLADAGEVERAVELYALAENHPFVAKSRLFEDIAGRHVQATAASLPPDVVAVAQARGRTLDWWDNAAALLKELPKLGWTD